MSDLIPFQPVEPADTQVSDLVDRCAADVQMIGGVNTMTRKLLPAERGLLQRRMDKLNIAMRPLNYSVTSELHKRAGATISRFLEQSFPSFNPGDIDNARKLIASYVAAVIDLPLFAIEAACNAISKGELTHLKMEGGYIERISLSFPPTPILLAAAAKTMLPLVGAEWSKIRKILSVDRLRELPRPDDPAKSDRVKEGMKILAHDMSERIKAEQKTIDEARAKVAIAANNETIIRQYREMGIQPVRSGNMLVTPSLLMNLGRAHLLQKSDDEWHGERQKP